jgi:polysaccharide pyruvyl transferase WcaK-like protein
MDRSKKIKRIGIFGHVGNQNLGDEAIITAVMQNIRCRYPGTEIYGFTINPDDTRNRHQITAFPIRRISKNSQPAKYCSEFKVHSQKPNKQSQLTEQIKGKLKAMPFAFPVLKTIQKGLPIFRDIPGEICFWRECYKNLRGIDLLIIAGSHQLNDYVGGPWAFPYTLLKWTVIAKATRTKVAFVSVGAGPIHSFLGKVFLRCALSLASYRSYRDEISKKQVEAIGVSGENPVFPDLVYSLKLPELAVPFDHFETSPPIVGINPMPLFHPAYWHEADARAYEHYLHELASFALWLMQRGYRVFFFPTQLRADLPVINDLTLIVEQNSPTDSKPRLVDRPIASFADLLGEMSRMDMIVATRFHGILLSYLLKKPVLGIAYHKKSEEIMATMGQAEYAIASSDLDVRALKKRFVSLESKCAALKVEIEQKLPPFKQALETQYDRIFELLEEK